MFEITKEMEALRQQGRLRALESISSPTGPTVLVGGKQYIMLASNDYLGLAAHPDLRQAAANAAKTWGAGSGAARLVSGTTVLHEELERDIAHFKKTETSLLFSTGYMANLGILTSLAGPQDAIFSDELNHASIIDGCRLSRARVVVYRHRDMNALEDLLRITPARRRIIVTDGVFSMDGDIAPLPDLLSLAKRFDAALVLDDAHGTGTIGSHGGGTLEHFNIAPCPEILLMGTMGKALGSFGAFFAGTDAVRNFLINRARSFIFTTSLPPPVLAASRKAIDILVHEPERVIRLQENAAYLRQGLRTLGFQITQDSTPIIPIMIGASEAAFAWARRLREQGLFVTAIRPPAVPEGASRLRLTVLATHTHEHLDTALAVFEKTARKAYGH